MKKIQSLSLTIGIFLLSMQPALANVSTPQILCGSTESIYSYAIATLHSAYAQALTDPNSHMGDVHTISVWGNNKDTKQREVQYLSCAAVNYQSSISNNDAANGAGNSQRICSDSFTFPVAVVNLLNTKLQETALDKQLYIESFKFMTPNGKAAADETNPQDNLTEITEIFANGDSHTTATPVKSFVACAQVRYQ